MSRRRLEVVAVTPQPCRSPLELPCEACGGRLAVEAPAAELAVVFVVEGDRVRAWCCPACAGASGVQPWAGRRECEGD